MQEKSLRNILLIALSGYLIYTLKNVLSPFLIALFLAYLINPLINFIQTKLRIKKRGFAIALGLTFSSILLSGLFLLSLPTINKEFHNAAKLLKEYADIIPPIPTELQEQVNQFLHSDQAKEFINSSTITETFNKVSPLIKALFNESLDLAMGVFGLFFILIYLVFILQGYPMLNKTWINWIPSNYREQAKGIGYDLNEGMRAYFRGQATIALIVGLLFCLGFSIIGLPLAILMGILIGLLNLVPYLQIVGFIPAFLLCILQSMETGQSLWTTIGLATLVFFIIQLIQESILIPRIMNKITGLHPAIILLSLSIWGSLLGITGLILALPISTLLLSYYKRFVNKELNQ
jgi:predicted PurR-regulated permease PerM